MSQRLPCDTMDPHTESSVRKTASPFREQQEELTGKLQKFQDEVIVNMVREAEAKDLNELLELYLCLHEESVPGQSELLSDTWKQILEDDNHHLIVNEVAGRIVSSCVCVIIPNLTRNVRPYAFVENVVTHTDFRGQGLASECLEYARQIAMQRNCYKMMLLTGSRKQETLDFYRRAGYNSTDKAAFIQWLDR